MIKKVKLTQENKKKGISKIRNNIDKIDSKIIKLLSLRRKQVIQITKYKKRSEIIDKKRIENILKRLVKKGKILEIEPYLITSIWNAMIKSFIKLEKEKI